MEPREPRHYFGIQVSLCTVSSVRIGKSPHRNLRDPHYPFVRTVRALQTKWQDIQLKCNQFHAGDHRASHIFFQSGGTDNDFRAKALNFYAEKYGEVFDIEHCYDFLKSKPKSLIDTAQDARDQAALGTTRGRWLLTRRAALGVG